MAWLNATWRRLRSIWRWSVRTNETGTTGYQSSCWPTEHQPMRPLAWRPPTWCSGGSFAWPLTWFSGLPRPKKSRRPTIRPIRTADLVERLHDIHHLPASTWKWPVTGRRHDTTSWPTQLVSNKATVCGCTALPERDESHRSFRRSGKARISTPGLTTWSTGSNGTPG